MVEGCLERAVLEQTKGTLGRLPAAALHEVVPLDLLILCGKCLGPRRLLAQQLQLLGRDLIYEILVIFLLLLIQWLQQDRYRVVLSYRAQTLVQHFVVGSLCHSHLECQVAYQAVLEIQLACELRDHGLIDGAVLERYLSKPVMPAEEHHLRDTVELRKVVQSHLVDGDFPQEVLLPQYLEEQLERAGDTLQQPDFDLVDSLSHF